MRRVVITGMGAITPVGLNVEEFWNSVKARQNMDLAEVTQFDTTRIQSTHGSRGQQTLMQKITWISKQPRRMEHFQPVCSSSSKRSH